MSATGKSKAGQCMPGPWGMLPWAWLTGAAKLVTLEGFLEEVTRYDLQESGKLIRQAASLKHEPGD